MQDGSPASPQPLEYATPDSDARVLFTREGDRATVVIRRPKRRAEAAWKLTGELLGESFMYLIIGGAIIAWMRPVWLLVLIPGTAALVGCVYGLAWLGHARLARPIVVELTPTELVFSNLDERARPSRLSLEGLYAIYYVSHAKCVFVRRRGQEMLGFGLTPHGGDSERIAAFLRDAAGLGSDGGGDGSLASSPPA